MGVAENGIKHQVGTKLILASDFLTFSSLLQQAHIFFFFLDTWLQLYTVIQSMFAFSSSYKNQN